VLVVVVVDKLIERYEKRKEEIDRVNGTQMNEYTYGSIRDDTSMYSTTKHRTTKGIRGGVSYMEARPP
jgi:hypothetical protein